ncbi:YceI family protein [Mucilaginibacter sp.]
MNKKYLPLLFLLFAMNFAIAQVKYTLTKATVTFQIKNMGINTSGNINDVQTNILFDAANLGSSSIEASANVKTINTDNDMRDEHLRGDSFFDVATYPKITMKSVAIKHKSGNNYVGQFNVTIKNKTHLLDVPFTYIENGNTADFSGVLKLKRTDFDIGGSSMVLSDDVTVNIDVAASK